MKLDLDLVRSILMEVEDTPANQAAGKITIADVDEATVLEHLELLKDRGLIDARLVRSGMGGDRILAANVERLTWEGHDWLAAARNDTVWRKTMKLIKEKGGGVAFELIKPILVQVAIQHFGVAG
ncbi:MAG: DUF2513 domain-containing protein [Gemmatimonadales bacterium]